MQEYPARLRTRAKTRPCSHAQPSRKTDNTFLDLGKKRTAAGCIALLTSTIKK